MTFLTAFVIVQAGILALTLAEFLYSIAKQDGEYSLRGTLGNLLRNMVTRLIQRTLHSVSSAYVFFAYIGLGYQNGPVGWSSVLACLVLVDLMYYFVHRTHHAFSFLWVFHSIHHGDDKFNLSTGMRVSWVQELYFATLLIAPCILLGFGSGAAASALLIFSLFQTSVHTAYIHFPKWLDLFLVTPHNHKIHHEQALGSQNSNFGGILSIWDRIFDTYTAESERSATGIEGYHQDNFIKMEIDPFLKYLRK